jgi:nucleoside-diphosphate-sugar epimerase
MRIGVTGATGFLGRYIVAHLVDQGHRCRCWFRPSSDLGGLKAPEGVITWIEGSLENAGSARELVEGCDAVVHAALEHSGGGFRGGEGDLLEFVEANVLGTIRLIEEARRADVGRFVFISTCAVHDRILGDRPLDEAHPLWPASHYGAHKAAIEAFVHSYGLGQGYAISALRPTGIYGLAHPPPRSKWFDLVAAVARGEDVECRRGGKEVHAADVARAVGLLLDADPERVAGQSFNCCDRYVSEHEVASIARDLSGGRGAVLGAPAAPKNQIVTDKLQALGMQFGGRPLLEQTVGELVEAHRRGY